MMELKLTDESNTDFQKMVQNLEQEYLISWLIGNDEDWEFAWKIYGLVWSDFFWILVIFHIYILFLDLCVVKKPNLLYGGGVIIVNCKFIRLYGLNVNHNSTLKCVDMIEYMELNASYCSIIVIIALFLELSLFTSFYIHYYWKSKKKQGYVYSFLETGKENIAAIATYEKLGYLKIENTGFFKEDEICLSMKKDLRSL